MNNPFKTLSDAIATIPDLLETANVDPTLFVVGSSLLAIALAFRSAYRDGISRRDFASSVLAVAVLWLLAIVTSTSAWGPMLELLAWLSTAAAASVGVAVLLRKIGRLANHKPPTESTHERICAGTHMRICVHVRVGAVRLERRVVRSLLSSRQPVRCAETCCHGPVRTSLVIVGCCRIEGRRVRCVR